MTDNMKDDETYKIQIIIHTQVVKTFYPATKEQAKRIYYRHADDADRYTLLIVNGMEFTTAQAESYFGGRDVDMRFLFVGGNQ
jgi:hypothetical protein